jgi:hypothetical protein
VMFPELEVGNSPLRDEPGGVKMLALVGIHASVPEEADPESKTDHDHGHDRDRRADPHR